MEPGHLLEGGRGHRRRARLDLVALHRSDDVLEQQGEPARLGLDLGDVDGGDPGADPGGDLAVEADLDLVGAQGQAGTAALVVGQAKFPTTLPGPPAGSSRCRVKRAVSAIWPVPIGIASEEVT